MQSNSKSGSEKLRTLIDTTNNLRDLCAKIDGLADVLSLSKYRDANALSAISEALHNYTAQMRGMVDSTEAIAGSALFYYIEHKGWNQNNKKGVTNYGT